MSRKKSSDETGKKKDTKSKLVQFKENKKGYHISYLMNFLRVIAYPIHALVYPFRLHGNKKVGKGACIYVGNHYCIWDVFYPAHTTREGIHFLAKMSILEAPILGFVAKKAGVIGANAGRHGCPYADGLYACFEKRRKNFHVSGRDEEHEVRRRIFAVSGRCGR